MSYYDIAETAREKARLEHAAQAQRQEARLAREEAARRSVAIGADRDADRAALRTMIEANTELEYRGFSIGTAMRLVAALERRYRITTITSTRSSARANIEKRTIYAPPITDMATFAIWLHEAGHILFGQCPGAGDHRMHRVFDVELRRDVAACVACETAASLKALQLAPCSRAMHEELARCLQSYLRTTSAPHQAQTSARRFVNGNAWREALVRRVAHQQRMDQFRRIQGWI